MQNCPIGCAPNDLWFSISEGDGYYCATSNGPDTGVYKDPHGPESIPINDNPTKYTYIPEEGTCLYKCVYGGPDDDTVWKYDCTQVSAIFTDKQTVKTGMQYSKFDSTACTGCGASEPEPEPDPEPEPPVVDPVWQPTKGEEYWGCPEGCFHNAADNPDWSGYGYRCHASEGGIAVSEDSRAVPQDPSKPVYSYWCHVKRIGDGNSTMDCDYDGYDLYRSGEQLSEYDPTASCPPSAWNDGPVWTDPDYGPEPEPEPDPEPDDPWPDVSPPDCVCEDRGIEVSQCVVF